ncbi:MAG: threonine--tRNA ligase, partial [Candidatus Pacebacteria bacterium]|nr:threonine--tRNA ligase [Candidatus Paceibacterota bacterium]MDD3072723.1 threonine--tRNA ligase [Candidatus Paceibacterota bacterium]MDD4201782.1 threonine--tRNA ligase [Candidatus Paceibacterota bacterium]MDD4897655.1 threonine--tRNA ligase [Candidatus Paceibacterota bacterium]
MSNIKNIRHSLAHIMAHAVKNLYPKVKFGMGPAIENGFYYDFDLGTLKVDLSEIEMEMEKIIKENIPFKKEVISKQKANDLFKGQKYKLEIINDIKGKNVSIFTVGKFTDLCEGPHIKNTKEINIESFKISRIAGAYFKGNEKNKMLTR